jgi:hypothetical protein
MSSVPPECQALADELLQLKQERAALQQELRSLAGPEKVNATRAINGLLGQIQQKARDLDVCLGRPTPPAPRTCTLTSGLISCDIARPRIGAAAFPLRITAAIAPTFTFSGLNFATVELLSSAVPLGTVSRSARSILGLVVCPFAVTVGQSRGIGSFDSQLGEVDIPLSLTFNPSPAWSGLIPSIVCPLSTASGPSTLAGTLTTRTLSSSLDPTLSISGFPLSNSRQVLTPGSTLRPLGSIALIMSGLFSRGFLAGSGCDLSLTGILSSPLP